MPRFEVTSPDGRTIEVTAPEGATEQQAIAYAQQNWAQLLAAQPKKESGLLAAGKSGLGSLISSGATGLESLFGDATQAGKRANVRDQARSDKYEDEIGLDKLGAAYDKDGLYGGAKEIARQVPLALAQQAPNIAASMAGARTGATLGGMALGPYGALGGGALGAFLPSAISQLGSNVAAQTEANPDAPVDMGKAVPSAVVQGAIDVGGEAVMLGKTLAGKVLGPRIATLLNKGTAESLKEAEKLAAEKVLPAIGKGALRSTLVEVPGEVTQDFIERWQAGKDLFSPEALKGYADTAYQTGLLAPIGAAGRVADRGAARTQVADNEKAVAAKQAADAKTAQDAADAKTQLEQQSPEYLAKLDKDYQAAILKLKADRASLGAKPKGDADPSALAAWEAKSQALGDYRASDEFTQLAQAHAARRPEIEAQRAQRARDTQAQESGEEYHPPEAEANYKAALAAHLDATNRGRAAAQAGDFAAVTAAADEADKHAAAANRWMRMVQDKPNEPAKPREQSVEEMQARLASIQGGQDKKGRPVDGLLMKAFGNAEQRKALAAEAEGLKQKIAAAQEARTQNETEYEQRNALLGAQNQRVTTDDYSGQLADMDAANEMRRQGVRDDARAEMAKGDKQKSLFDVGAQAGVASQTGLKDEGLLQHKTQRQLDREAAAKQLSMGPTGFQTRGKQEQDERALRQAVGDARFAQQQLRKEPEVAQIGQLRTRIQMLKEALGLIEPQRQLQPTDNTQMRDKLGAIRSSVTSTEAVEPTQTAAPIPSKASYKGRIEYNSPEYDTAHAELKDLTGQYNTAQQSMANKRDAARTRIDLALEAVRRKSAVPEAVGDANFTDPGKKREGPSGSLTDPEGYSDLKLRTGAVNTAPKADTAMATRRSQAIERAIQGARAQMEPREQALADRILDQLEAIARNKDNSRAVLQWVSDIRNNRVSNDLGSIEDMLRPYASGTDILPEPNSEYRNTGDGVELQRVQTQRALPGVEDTAFEMSTSGKLQEALSSDALDKFRKKVFGDTGTYKPTIQFKIRQVKEAMQALTDKIAKAEEGIAKMQAQHAALSGRVESTKEAAAERLNNLNKRIEALTDKLDKEAIPLVAKIDALNAEMRDSVDYAFKLHDLITENKQAMAEFNENTRAAFHQLFVAKQRIEEQLGAPADKRSYDKLRALQQELARAQQHFDDYRELQREKIGPQLTAYLQTDRALWGNLSQEAVDFSELLAERDKVQSDLDALRTRQENRTTVKRERAGIETAEVERGMDRQLVRNMGEAAYKKLVALEARIAAARANNAPKEALEKLQAQLNALEAEGKPPTTETNTYAAEQAMLERKEAIPGMRYDFNERQDMLNEADELAAAAEKYQAIIDAETSSPDEVESATTSRDRALRTYTLLADALSPEGGVVADAAKKITARIRELDVLIDKNQAKKMDAADAKASRNAQDAVKRYTRQRDDLQTLLDSDRGIERTPVGGKARYDTEGMNELNARVEEIDEELNTATGEDKQNLLTEKRELVARRMQGGIPNRERIASTPAQKKIAAEEIVKLKKDLQGDLSPGTRKAMRRMLREMSMVVSGRLPMRTIGPTVRKALMAGDQRTGSAESKGTLGWDNTMSSGENKLGGANTPTESGTRKQRNTGITRKEQQQANDEAAALVAGQPSLADDTTDYYAATTNAVRQQLETLKVELVSAEERVEDVRKGFVHDISDATFAPQNVASIKKEISLLEEDLAKREALMQAAAPEAATAEPEAAQEKTGADAVVSVAEAQQDGVKVEAKAVGGTSVAISYIETTGKKRHGRARVALKAVIAEADKQGVTLTLSAEAPPGAAMNSLALEQWYIRNGFKVYDGGMYREPRIAQPESTLEGDQVTTLRGTDFDSGFDGEYENQAYSKPGKDRAQSLMSAELEDAVRDGRILDAVEALERTGSTLEVRALAAKLRPLVLRTKLEVVDNLTHKGEPVAGVYIPEENTIKLHSEALAEEDFLHELMHAATDTALLSPLNELTASQREARASIEALWKQVQGRKDLMGEHGITSVREFVAEVATNDVFRTKLDSVGKPTSLLERLKGWVAKLINIFKGDTTPTSGKTRALTDKILAPSRKLKGEQTPSVMHEGTNIRRLQVQAPDNRGFFQRVTDGLGMALESGIVDVHAPVIRALQAAGGTANKTMMQAMYMTRKANQSIVTVQQVLSNGTPTWAKADSRGLVGAVVDGGVSATDVLRLVQNVPGKTGEDKYALTTEYIAALRTVQKGGHILGGGQDTYNAAKALIAGVKANPGAYTALEAVRAKYKEYNTGLIHFARDSGAISAAEAKEYLTGDYIPLYRNNNGKLELSLSDDRFVSMGDIKHTPFLHQLKGSEAKVMPLNESIIYNTKLLVDMAMANKQKKDIAFAMSEVGKAAGKKATMQVRDRKGKTDDDTNLYWRVEPVDGEDSGYRHLVLDTEGTVMAGVPTDVLAGAMKGFHATMPAYVRWSAALNDYLRAGVTRTPAFLMRQLARDSIAASSTTGLKAGPLAAMYKTVSNFAESYTKDGKSLDEMNRRALIQSNIMTGDVDDMAKLGLQIGGPDGVSATRKFLNFLDSAAHKADAATRKQIWDDAKQQGLSDIEAEYRVMESMNFHKRGAWESVQHANRMLPFFNSTIQGLNVAVKALQGKMPFEERVKVRDKFLNNAMWLFAYGVLYSAAMSGDDDYNKLQPEDRIGNLHIPLPGGGFFKVPVGYMEVGGLAFAASQYIAEQSRGDTDAMQTNWALAKYIGGGLPGGGGLPLPPILKQAAEYKAEYDFARFQKTISRSLSQLDPEQQYNESTLESFKALGHATGMSPIKLQRAVDSLFSNAASGALGLLEHVTSAGEKDGHVKADKDMSRRPFFSGLTQNTDTSSKAVQYMYDTAEKVVKKADTLSKMQSQGKPRDEVLAYRDEHIADIKAAPMGRQFIAQMGTINKQIQQIYNGAGDGPTKQERVKDLQKRQDALAQRYMQAMKGVLSAA